MGEYLILEWSDRGEAQRCLDVINSIMISIWASRGYTILNTPAGDAVVSKNAETGEDEIDKPQTFTWAILQKSNENKYFFGDPTNNPAFFEWESKAAHLGYHFDGTRKVLNFE